MSASILELIQLFLLLELGSTYVLGLIAEAVLITELLEIKESEVCGRERKW